ncbi:Putative ribonuclease H protein At1g65750 [Linum perenne]
MGLHIAWDRGLKKVELQVDALTILNLVEAECDPRHQHAMKFMEIRDLLRRDWEIRIRHVYREGNRAADFLAGIGFQFPLGYHLIPTSNVNLGFHLRYDCIGITEPRSVILNN